MAVDCMVIGPERGIEDFGNYFNRHWKEVGHSSIYVDDFYLNEELIYKMEKNGEIFMVGAYEEKMPIGYIFVKLRTDPFLKPYKNKVATLAAIYLIESKRDYKNFNTMIHFTESLLFNQFEVNYIKMVSGPTTSVESLVNYQGYRRFETIFIKERKNV